MMDKSKRLNIASLAAILLGALAGRGGKASEAVAATAMATSEAMALKYSRENGDGGRSKRLVPHD